MSKHQDPPLWMIWLVEQLVRERFHDELIGDLYEWYHFKATKYTPRRLRWRFAWEVFRTLRWFRLRKVSDIFLQLTDQLMIRNDLKMAVRSTVKRRFNTSVNVIGLSTGFAVCFFIYAFVSHLYSFDSFHKKYDDIYRILRYDQESDMRNMAMPTKIPEAIHAAYEGALPVASLGQDNVVAFRGQEQFFESGFYWTTQDFFKVFDFPLIQGNPDDALTIPNGVVITERMAEKVFGSTDVLGEAMDVKIYDSDTLLTMQVTGVMANPPVNSHLQFEMLGAMVTGEQLYSWLTELWGFFWLRSYTVLPESYSAADVEQQMNAYFQGHVADEWKSHLGFKLQPLEEVFLHSGDMRLSPKDIAGDYKLPKIFTGVGLLVFFVALLNFINLSTAQLNQRAMEVGVRKTLGAVRSRLIQQFLTETYLIVTVSLLIATVIVLVAWPWFQNLSGWKIPLNQLNSLTTWLLVLCVWFLTGILAGGYPAKVLSGFHPIIAFKKRQSRNKTYWRQGLVTTQIALSTLMLSGAVIVFAQFRHLMDGDLGFDDEQLVVVPVEDRTAQRTLAVFRDEAARLPGIDIVSMSGESLPSQFNATMSLQYEGQDPDAQLGIRIVAIDPYYFEALGVPLVAGRTVRGVQQEGWPNELVLNQAALAVFGWEEALGKEIRLDDLAHTVVGVVQDYYQTSLKGDVGAVAYLPIPTGMRAGPDNLIVRIQTGQSLAALQGLEDLWQKRVGSIPFQFHFVDQAFDQYYKSEKHFFALFGVFSGFGIMIACIGLLAMVLFVINQRRKELSIRKVLGASTEQVVTMVAKEFTLMAALALVIAIPIAYLGGYQWLSAYPNRIAMDWVIWLIVVGLSMGICWLTIGYHTLKAARANPAKYLKDA